MIQIREVSPRSIKEVLPGTRLCAYWSDKFFCLYPGISAEPINTEQSKDDEVIVEFDDGDSGRINLKEIRFLMPEYPFVGMYSTHAYIYFYRYSKLLYIINCIYHCYLQSTIIPWNITNDGDQHPHRRRSNPRTMIKLRRHVTKQQRRCPLINATRQRLKCFVTITAEKRKRRKIGNCTSLKKKS